MTPSRRAVLGAGLGIAALSALPASAQVEVGAPSRMRKLVPAEALESAAQKQYVETLGQAKAKGVLLPDAHPQVQRVRAIAKRLIPHTYPWNDRARQWDWAVSVIDSPDVNAFCMPGGKIAFFTGLLGKLSLSDEEVAMVMGHEMAHALREHAREQMAKGTATSLGLRLGAELLGLGDWGSVAADMGTQLLTLKFSRQDESEADLVGLDLAARAAYNPKASVSLWEKMAKAGGGGNFAFLSTHPSGPARIKQLQANVPKVMGLYEAAKGKG